MIRKTLILIAFFALMSATVRTAHSQDPFNERETQSGTWRPGPRSYPTQLDEDDTVSPDERLAQGDSGVPGSRGDGSLSSGGGILERLNQMQSQIDALTPVDTGITNPTRGIVPGFRRSTDVPRIEDLQATPAYPRVRLTGFFQADGGWFAQDTRNVQTLGNIQDVVGFRRTRLAAVGDVSKSVGYMLEMDFSFPGRPSFMDVWADIRDVPLLGIVRVGQWRMPFGMDELTSVRELQFIERFLGFAQAPFRQTGIGFHNRNEQQTVTWDVAGFKFPTDFFGDAQGDRGYGMAARVTALPFYNEESNQLIHLGADYSFIAPAGKTIQFRNQAEFGGPFIVTQPNAFAPPGSPQSLAGNLGSLPNAIDTGAVPVQYYQLFDAELGAAAGSWYMQSEARYAFLNQLSGHASTLPTYYIETGYFLTGEVRPYNKLAGVFSRVKPKCKWGEDGGLGAFEVAFRYSYADFNGTGFQGNRLNDLTWGLNWYLNQYMKFQFNYIHSMLANAVHGSSDFDTYAMRAQLDF